MKCPKCQHENREAAKFCDDCGHQLSTLIIASPQTLSIDDKIDKIQRYLPKGLTEKILAQRGKIEGERKQVTVMFCDMEGFTQLVEKLGSEKAYSIMDEVYEILIHKVHDYEGTVNEMTGDGIMALFGAPIALEDAPQRALRSALAIHSEIAKFNGNRKGMAPIKMRIGVHTGPVVVGTLGNDLRVEFKAVGDTVNLASRVEGLAEPGTTFLTEDTFKLTGQLFKFEALGEREIKGKEGTLPVYKLLSGKGDAHRPRVGFERSIYSEMVGRDKELDELEFQVMKAIRGKGSIVNIIGEAGIGKSRLIAELKNCDVIKKVFLLEGRAISTGRNLSFHPIIDLLKQWARIAEDDSSDAAFNKLDNAIRKVAPEDMDEILPFVATLMGMKLSGRYAERIKGIEGEALEKLILKNMRDLIIKATEMKPHVIVMEDLHWSDTTSIELIESLFRLAQTQRIVFINVFRPGYKETGDRIIENLKEKAEVYHVEINLQPLDIRMSETLIINMLQIKGLRHAVIGQIVERADGNPFFIEEVVRSFIDQGAVVQKDGAFEVTEKIDKMVIPNTINDVLMARIDRLEEKTRDLVKVASVIGRSFFYRILKEMSKTIEDIDNKLSYLQEIQLFRERKRMEEIEYLFKHALAQEAAYESILSETRKELHLKVAESIENVFKERLHEFYGMLAYHYSKGENLDKAEEYMIKAGEEALSSSASSEALRYYQDALDLYLKKYGETADPEKQAMLERNIAIALANRGEMEDALVYFDRVLKRLGVKVPKIMILMLIKFFFDLLVINLRLYLPSKKAMKAPTQKDSEIFYLSHRKDEALLLLDPMRLFFENTGTVKRIFRFDFKKINRWCYTLFSSAANFAISGFSLRLSYKILNYGENYIDKDNFREAFCLTFFRAVTDFFSGKLENIQWYDEFILDENLKVGEFFNVTIAIGNYAWVKIFQGKIDEANAALEKISKIADEYENKFATQYRFLIEKFLYLHWRKLNNAKDSLDNWELLFKVKPDQYSIIHLADRADLQILNNQYDDSKSTINQMEEIKKKQPIIPLNTASYYLWTKLFLHLRLLEKSVRSDMKPQIAKYKKMASKSSKKFLKHSKKSPLDLPRSLRMLGRYYWLIGDQNKSIKFWMKSIEKAERLGTRPDLSRTYMEIGKRFLEKESKYKELNGITAKEYLEKAREMFKEMDLQWDLDELDKITAAN